MQRHPEHSWRRLGLLGAIILALGVFTAPNASADHRAGGSTNLEVLAWNKIAFEALTNPGTAPTPGAGQPGGAVAVHLAMVHRAIDLALATNDNGHRQGDRGRPVPFSTAAGAATAAYKVLIGLTVPEGGAAPPGQVPLPDPVKQNLAQLHAASVDAATASDGAAAVAAGVAAGEAAAAAVLKERQSDGRYGPYRFATSTAIGLWDEAGPPPAPPTLARFDWLAQVDPFVVNSADQFRSRGPNGLTSAAYARDFDEVKAKGRASGSTRTTAQQASADFFNVNALELFNRTFRTIATDRKLTPNEQARLFALLTSATADSLITCWADKGRYLFWRPITAIRNGDQDGNNATTGEPGWTPYVGTPPYPDHASGYNCISGAMMFTARDYFGTDRFRFALQKAGTDEIRKYTRFSDVVRDTIDVRVWQGLHFRTADVQGARIGQNVANWVSVRCPGGNAHG